jgi:bacteriocin biosynthesis cyclodehydratase domain-containing protein
VTGVERETSAGQPAGALRWSPTWTVRAIDASQLEISAGADESYVVDGLDRATMAAVEGWQEGAPVCPSGPSEAAVADHLTLLGALIADLAPTAAVAVAGSGPVAAAVVSAIELGVDPGLPGGFGVCLGQRRPPVEGAPPTGADLTVVVAESATRPAAPATTHLWVDATGHHTVVLGPLVVPGYTACRRCLDTRLARRWRPPAVPPQPKITGATAVVGQLVAIQVELALRGASPLANATIAWDLAAGTCTRDDLLKVPGCDQCRSWLEPGPATAAATGTIPAGRTGSEPAG